MRHFSSICSSASSALLQIGLGYWLSRGLHVVATLGIGDLLRNGPQSADELANVTTRLRAGSHSRARHMCDYH
jgi:hypothetical protein